MDGTRGNDGTRRRPARRGRRRGWDGASFRELVDRAVAGVYVSTPDGRILYCNSALARILGYESPEDVQAAGALGVYLDPADRDRWRERVERAGSLENYEATLRRRDGAVVHVLENVRAVRDAAGRVVAYEGSLIDVTERVRAVEEVTRLKDHLEAIADSTAEGLLAVLYTDGPPVVTYANRRFGEIFGLDPRAVVGRSDDEVRAEAAHCFKDPEGWERGVQELYRDRERVDRVELELVAPEPRILERYSGPIRRAGGEVIGRIWAFRDVTDARALERQLRHAQKLEAVGGLAAGVAHEFNNVLGGILALAQAALGELPEGAALRPILAQIEQAARRGGALTRQLLAFARRVEPGLQPVDLNALVAETRGFLAPSLGAAVRVELHLTHGLPKVLADPALLQQVLVNLCLNARDAMPEGGTVRIRTREPVRPPLPPGRAAGRRFAVVEVEDEGPGIPAHLVDRVFEPFFTTKPPGQGSGLGLAVVYGIVERHEGHIEVETRPGHGALFRVYLPLAPAGLSGHPRAAP